jgi:hypothetical protein
MIYFFALAVAPCGDAKDCSDLKKSEMCQDDSEHKDETCTPFCVCSCCAAHFLLADQEPNLVLLAEINTAYPAYEVSQTSEAILPIWQPPKLS